MGTVDDINPALPQGPESYGGKYGMFLNFG